jgi:hypothetical protein
MKVIFERTKKAETRLVNKSPYDGSMKRDVTRALNLLPFYFITLKSKKDQFLNRFLKRVVVDPT